MFEFCITTKYFTLKPKIIKKLSKYKFKIKKIYIIVYRIKIL